MPSLGPTNGKRGPENGDRQRIREKEPGSINLFAASWILLSLPPYSLCISKSSFIACCSHETHPPLPGPKSNTARWRRMGSEENGEENGVRSCNQERRMGSGLAIKHSREENGEENGVRSCNQAFSGWCVIARPAPRSFVTPIPNPRTRGRPRFPSAPCPGSNLHKDGLTVRRSPRVRVKARVAESTSQTHNLVC